MSNSGPLDTNTSGLGNLLIRWGTEFNEAENDFHELSWQRQALVVIASIVGGLFLIVGAFPAFVWAAKALKVGEDLRADRVNSVTTNRFSKEKTTSKESITSKTNRLEVDVSIFGKAFWDKVLGDVGEEPDFPPNINKTLQEDCRFVEGKKVWQTHDLVLVPERIGNKDYTLRNLVEVVSDDKLTCNALYRVNQTISDKDYDEKLGSHWILVVKKTIEVPESTPGNREQHLELIRADLKMKNLSYDLLGLRDLIFVVLMRYFYLNERGVEYHSYTKGFGPGSHTLATIQGSSKPPELYVGAAGARATSYKNVLVSRFFID